MFKSLLLRSLILVFWISNLYAIEKNEYISTIRNERVFEETLIPTRNRKASVDAYTLLKLTRNYKDSPQKEDFSSFENFIKDHPLSPWNGSIQLNLGLSYFHFGYFSKSIKCI